MKHEKLLAKVESPDLKALLEDWKWLIPEDDWTFVVITAMGDLIIKNPKGEYFYLDTIEAKFFQVAKSEEEMWALPKDKDFRRKFLQYYLVLNMIDEEMHLSENECYSPDVPPILGGELEVENLKPTDIYVHFSMIGQIWNQAKDMEPGTKINAVNVEAPKQSFLSSILNIFK